MKRRKNITKPVTITKTASAKDSECRICITYGLSFLNLSTSVFKNRHKRGLE